LPRPNPTSKPLGWPVEPPQRAHPRSGASPPRSISRSRGSENSHPAQAPRRRTTPQR
jgi:hypothetical protein